MKESEAEEKGSLQKTQTQNLLRYDTSGVYFARVRIGGKLFRGSLKTKVYDVAKDRLRDFISERRKLPKAVKAAGNGRMTFADALKIYRLSLDENPRLKPSAKLYREKCVAALLKSWPTLAALDVRKVTAADCGTWAKKYASDYSSTVYNNTVGTLRMILAIAIEQGAIYSNPAAKIKKVRVISKKPELPSKDDFPKMVASVRTAGSRFSKDCGDMIEFLAFGGFRKGEIPFITGADCDFVKGQIHVKGDPVLVTKNSKQRFVPMIDDMRRLLDRIKSERGDQWLKSPVIRIEECQKAIDSAVKKLGIVRITHHDLRHLFATRCIESGVDIPTVSRWLGHSDGGALAMKTYGHLRDEHSTEMAAKVSFGNGGGK